MGALALGLVAAATGPALAQRHTPAPPSGQQVSAPTGSSPTANEPQDNRHSP
ncbi:hypothetical protein RM572_11225 [Streptomyces sp. DSM 42041]|uniref:Tat pathway signal sequence domain protein n=1 Tax=Streptomyces hazeniae TaxID=3075538 RepID=A0ABU2NUR4_9ACTN|nr:hypothetical protein [Streptomyces sp. DSM 42041]MDT0379338.1 hypothetical protein [Streptomyces sp. DSM 42041]